MAVFTHISLEETRAFLDQYPQFSSADLTSLTPITAGTDNSNYKITVGKKDYILTIFETRLDPTTLPAIFDFAYTINKNVIFSPTAYLNSQNAPITDIKNKPGAIFDFLSGKTPEKITKDHCFKIGECLAKMHLIASTTTSKLPDNPLSLNAWQKLFSDHQNKIETESQPLIYNTIKKFESHLDSYKNLPRGAIHADLFPDNVFFENDNISAVIDFYFACQDSFLYDTMITCHGWCFDKHGGCLPDHLAAFIGGYQSIRPFTVAEKNLIFTVGAGAAVRIALTRFRDYKPATAHFIPHDPMAYVTILRWYETGAVDLKTIL